MSKKLGEVITLKDLTQLNDTDLGLLKETIIGLIRNRRESNSILIKTQVCEGMSVKVDHKKLEGFDCEVVKVNRKKVVIKCSKGQFTVPMGMLILNK